MYIQKPIDGVQSFFITISMAVSKRTKTYPRVRGKFTLQKENTTEYSRYLDLKSKKLMDLDPLRDLELKEFWELYDKYAQSENLHYFVFDIKRESHCRVECLASSQLTGTKEIDGLHWRNEIYISMMKDRKSLRTLSSTEIYRLFDKEWFWEEVLSQYVFAILKL